ncbi:hypothetical protein WICPIJ_008341 [Wickerhamomyces pijperi]|uniref:Uncharacterized protein n=1 Tax=Wickerhamomyces pijperi TaxID=599730 RepID=A0A9P8THZ6_WICPI|nr:hypothetical protein WICPIJ_008341 [Wickerhamomyces pijperi]
MDLDIDSLRLRSESMTTEASNLEFSSNTLETSTHRGKMYSGNTSMFVEVIESTNNNSCVRHLMAMVLTLTEGSENRWMMYGRQRSNLSSSLRCSDRARINSKALILDSSYLTFRREVQTNERNIRLQSVRFPTELVVCN